MTTRSIADEVSLEERVARLEQALAAERARVAELTQERDKLRASHERLRLEVELLRRRIFVAKAERVDTQQLELEFADKLQQLDALAGTLGLGKTDEDEEPEGAGASGGRSGRSPRAAATCARWRSPRTGSS